MRHEITTEDKDLIVEQDGNRDRDGNIITAKTLMSIGVDKRYVIAAAKSKNFIMIGEPGTGKTLTLQYAANLAYRYDNSRPPVAWFYEPEVILNLRRLETADAYLDQMIKNIKRANTILMDDWFQPENWIGYGKEGHFNGIVTQAMNLIFDLLYRSIGEKRIICGTNNAPEAAVPNERIMRRIAETFTEIIQ